MSSVLPSYTPHDIIIVRIHREPAITYPERYHSKYPFLPSQLEILEKFKNVSIFPDLSAATMKCKEFSQIVCWDPDEIRDALISWDLISTLQSSSKQKRPLRPAMIIPLWSDKHRRHKPTDPDWLVSQLMRFSFLYKLWIRVPILVQRLTADLFGSLYFSCSLFLALFVHILPLTAYLGLRQNCLPLSLP